ncbi:MAG: acyl-phosphate glycerol 3-phosphate acyltransferase [Bacteroidetes bacterium]|nr:MAG: acyl-phosphate glycerol 3-phosphate acyltransferase [Bacteroidota bacterium]RLD93619.1 MAG: acyl-phosphate glycerol 3-phosphate acyltransferase [Bacteroidota bacterium]
MYWFFIIIPGAYLLGSIPTSVWLGKALKGVDLREHGSGNAGATNAFRVLGKPIGSAVLVLDMLKGFLAVNLALLQHELVPGSEAWMILKIGLGLLAVVGHIFPVFAGFRGGKGVATITGVALAIHPLAALAAMGIYLLVFLLTRISAMGSLTAVLTYPIWINWVFKSEYLTIRIFSLLVVLLVLITHRSNILRLVRGEEKSLFRKQGT